ncbi:hypothetical protein AA0117_g2903 [Alternaria alternata]|uniref:DUF427 domain-containing protein n=1 Tax=Alternaria alternata TaxID=5599 RepID=A0A4Q4NRV1_ALTAL|nr:hypothetical protein AA0117_g2903 [Alternaria alternata]RYN89801.1 hypothetical protein AA0120_g6597 [Alternaria tenuissima]
MTRSKFDSPSRTPRGQFASPRHSLSIPPTRSCSARQGCRDDYEEDQDGQKWEPARGNTLSSFIADSPSSVSTTMEGDNAILNTDQLREQLSQVRLTADNEYLDRLQTEEQLRSESARPDSYVEQFERHEQRVRELEADVVRLEAALAGARAEARQQDVIMSALEARLATVNSSSAITTTSYYVPISSFTSNAKLLRGSAIDGTNGGADLGVLTVGNRDSNRILIFNTGKLKDLVKVDFRAVDQWFEEDMEIYGHPKDPYKRIDILPSSRNVRVAIDGVTLAESSSPLFLLETTLRTRHYLPPTSVNWEYLTPSNTVTLCPYKGRAEYYNVNIGGKLYRDLVWYYRYPTSESAPIAGYMCFYNELVEVYVDGVKETS